MELGQKLLFVVVSITLLICFRAVSAMPAGGSPQSRVGVTPKNGFVPNRKTAIAIAEAVLVPVYGEEKIKSEEPFSATLDGDTWWVRGSLPKGFVGGVAEIEISKSKGCILQMVHGK
jgi:hypothetical protein